MEWGECIMKIKKESQIGNGKEKIYGKNNE